MDHIPINGSMNKVNNSGSNGILKLIQVSKILQTNKQIHLDQIQIMLPEIFLIIFKKEIHQPGQCMPRLCLLIKDSNIDGMFLISLRYGLMEIIPLSQLVKWFWTETQKTILLKLNNLLSLHLIWFLVLSHHSVKCSREDFSHIPIPIDIDLVQIMIKFQLIVPTEPEYTTTKEMVPWLSMGIKDLNQIMNLILWVLIVLDLRLRLVNLELLVWLVDINLLIQIVILHNLVLYIEKLWLIMIEVILLRISLVILKMLEEISKKDKLKSSQNVILNMDKE